MILRLREAHINNLEKARSAEGVSDLEAETIVCTSCVCFVCLCTIHILYLYERHVLCHLCLLDNFFFFCCSAASDARGDQPLKTQGGAQS